MLEVDSGYEVCNDGMIVSKYLSGVLTFLNDSKIKCV